MENDIEVFDAESVGKSFAYAACAAGDEGPGAFSCEFGELNTLSAV